MYITAYASLATATATTRKSMQTAVFTMLVALAFLLTEVLLLLLMPLFVTLMETFAAWETESSSALRPIHARKQRRQAARSAARIAKAQGVARVVVERARDRLERRREERAETLLERDGEGKAKDVEVCSRAGDGGIGLSGGIGFDSGGERGSFEDVNIGPGEGILLKAMRRTTND